MALAAAFVAAAFAAAYFLWLYVLRCCDGDCCRIVSAFLGAERTGTGLVGGAPSSASSLAISASRLASSVVPALAVCTEAVSASSLAISASKLASYAEPPASAVFGISWATPSKLV